MNVMYHWQKLIAHQHLNPLWKSNFANKCKHFYCSLKSIMKEKNAALFYLSTMPPIPKCLENAGLFILNVLQSS